MHYLLNVTSSPLHRLEQVLLKYLVVIHIPVELGGEIEQYVCNEVNNNNVVKSHSKVFDSVLKNEDEP